jgi:hypothetical protein
MVMLWEVLRARQCLKMTLLPSDRSIRLMFTIHSSLIWIDTCSSRCSVFRNRPKLAEREKKSSLLAVRPWIGLKSGQYSGSEKGWIFSATSGRFPVGRTRNWLADPRKIRRLPKPEYCFHEISGISRSWPFPCHTVPPV